MQIVPFAINKISSPFKSTTYLDTASVPEIVYHEYSHLALSDFISVRSDALVSEGYANYFAAVISNNTNIGDKLGNLGKNAPGFNGKFRGTYRMTMDLYGQEHSGFIYSLLTNIKDEILNLYTNKLEGEKIADKIIYDSRKFLKYKNGAVKDLLSAIQVAIVTSGGPKKRLIMKNVEKVGNKFGI
jgi:hypothetical protein